MFAKNPDPAAPACGNPQCRRPFGHPVPFCPFCGTPQLAPTAPPPTPPRQTLPPTPQPPVPTPPNRTTSVPTTPPATPPGPPPPAHTRPQPTTPEPNTPPAAKRRGRTPLALALIIALAAAWAWLTHHPAPASIPFRVTITPAIDATITIDGADAPPGPLSAPPGTHRIGLRAPHWHAPEATLTLSAAPSPLRTIFLAAIPDPATLHVETTPPNATILINNRRAGLSPATLVLPPGPLRLATDLPGYDATTQSLTLAPGEQRTLALALARPPDTHLTIEAPTSDWSKPIPLPSGANITLLFKGPLRLRLRNQTYFLENPTTNLGTLDAKSLQLKSPTPTPVQVEIITTPLR